MTALYFFRERNMSIFAQKDINFVPLAVRLSGHFEGSADDVTPVCPPVRPPIRPSSSPSKKSCVSSGENCPQMETTRQSINLGRRVA